MQVQSCKVHHARWRNRSELGRQNRAEAEVAEAGFEMGVFAPWITMGPWGVGLSASGLQL